MYSTSSSECECDEYCCGANYEDQSVFGRSPFYSTMGQPLIYYAQMPTTYKRQRSREKRKENKNCFAKAFKWYTQEHVPQHNSPNKIEMNEFVAWLDSKYEEFLGDSQLDNVCHLKMKQTSIIEANRIPYNTCCEPLRSKRFRMKSPWRKKNRFNSKEAGDTVQKANQSFQFILKPKELTRVTSEVQPSNATMVSTEIPVKATIKSQSYTLVTYELESRSSHDKFDKTVIKAKTSQNKALQNISCQCSIMNVQKKNTQTQYDSTFAKKSFEMVRDNQNSPRTISYSRNPQRNQNASTIPNNHEQGAMTANDQAQVIETLCQCTEEPNSNANSQSSHQTHSVECESSLSTSQSSSKTVKTCPCEREGLDILNMIPNPITFLNNGAQTSDHSIDIGKATTHGYPLFIKIICADKLCKQ